MMALEEVPHVAHVSLERDHDGNDILLDLVSHEERVLPNISGGVWKLDFFEDGSGFVYHIEDEEAEDEANNL